MDDFLDTQPMGLYEDSIGTKSQDYYLNKFENFDQIGEGWNPSWNWAAFFFTGFWALYRKMYGWFFAWWLFGTIGSMFMKSENHLVKQGLGIAYLASFFGFAIYANSIYHRKLKSKIAAAQQSTTNTARVNRRLIAGGGVHAWVPNAFMAIFAIGVMAAIGIPAYQDYTTRQAPPITVVENDKIASPKENPFDKPDLGAARPVETVAPQAKSTTDQEHLGRIYAAHPDADAINDSPSFKSWVAQYPVYQHILAQGSTQEVIEMFTAYKNQR